MWMFKKRQFKKSSTRYDWKNFGKLTVKEINSTIGETKYLCQCECGNFTVSDAWSLKSGHKTSCGCVCKDIQKKFVENKKEDLTNKRFGKLVAISDTERRESNGNIIWKCKCDCGSICYESSNVLLQGKVESCGCLKSKGEEKISKIFINNNINFKKQYTFDDLKNKSKLRFDFGILDDYDNLLYLVEYDGIQHFAYSGRGWNNLINYSKSKCRDELKNEYCLKNNIPLIRIPYTHFDNIELKDLIIGSSFMYKEVN